MKIYDKNLKVKVDVSNKKCPNRECYWARLDPGVFVPGQGYKNRRNKPNKDYRCGNRDIHGCPDKYCHYVKM